MLCYTLWNCLSVLLLQRDKQSNPRPSMDSATKRYGHIFPWSGRKTAMGKFSRNIPLVPF